MVLARGGAAGFVARPDPEAALRELLSRPSGAGLAPGAAGGELEPGAGGAGGPEPGPTEGGLEKF